MRTALGGSMRRPQVDGKRISNAPPVLRTPIHGPTGKLAGRSGPNGVAWADTAPTVTPTYRCTGHHLLD